MHGKKWLLWMAVALAMAGQEPVSAQVSSYGGLIHLSVWGKITQAAEDVFGPSAQVGTPYQATITVDLGACDNIYVGSTNLLYLYPFGPQNQESVQFGDYTSQSSSESVYVWNNSIYRDNGKTDSVVLGSDTGDGSGLSDVTTAVELYDTTGTALSSAFLYEDNPALSDANKWDKRFFFLSAWNTIGNDATYGYFYGSIDGLQTVPEPGSIALFVAVGITGVGFLLRRRKQ